MKSINVDGGINFQNKYRISSNNTRGYYFFAEPSTAGIIRTRVLIEGWYYYQNFINPQTLKTLLSKSRGFFLRGVIKNKNK